MQQKPDKAKIKLSLGYSPCPNDTFIFYALTHKKITGGVEFYEALHDVETLNRMAMHKELDITKASFHAFAYLREDYCLLRSGSAVGRGCGPLVVAKSSIKITGRRIAVPGRLTTACLLLKLFEPDINIVEMPFNSIMNAVSLGMVDAGVIIHEGRFTYPRYNLVKVVDLGEWWEEETGLPLPLGGILARRDLGEEIIKESDRMLRESICYALENPSLTWGYVKSNAQELEDEVITQHLNLYVNDYTLDIGDGAKAVEKLLKIAEEMGVVPSSASPIFY